ncbi:hypothetical protein H4R34_003517 [Dimargaris verticillata]|uniref:Uncharacterized protein n=1 Tax=Dimargaris verticillata TaxID=2761393 RepID=A0A9W8B228_9FUNG|nr:hypothetical protein H4R34_003517 [Dimargaris verticillata]
MEAQRPNVLLANVMALAIVLLGLGALLVLAWFIVWRMTLSNVPLVREFLGLEPPALSASAAPTRSHTLGSDNPPSPRLSATTTRRRHRSSQNNPLSTAGVSTCVGGPSSSTSSLLINTPTTAMPDDANEHLQPLLEQEGQHRRDNVRVVDLEPLQQTPLHSSTTAPDPRSPTSSSACELPGFVEEYL